MPVILTDGKYVASPQPKWFRCTRCGGPRTVAQTTNAGWQVVCPVCERA